MKKFFTLSILALLIQGMGLQANAKTCEGEMFKLSSPFHFAYENLKSFAYLNHAVIFLQAQNPQAKICFSAAVLTQNTLGYNEYLFQIDVALDKDAAPFNRISLLFQDGPIQAYHNALGLPWIGLENTKVNALLSEVYLSAEFKIYPRKSNDPLELIQQTAMYQFRKEQILSGTLNAVEFRGPNASEKYFLVTWLKTQQYAYSKDLVLPEGSVVVLDSKNQFKVVEDVNLFTDVLQNLHKINFETKPSVAEQNVWIQQLIKFSYVY